MSQSAALEQVDERKRRFLLAASSTVGGIATVAIAWPFIASMKPSQRAQAAGAPVEVDVSKIEPGSYVTVEWQGKPVWVVNRTKEMMEKLPSVAALLADPGSESSKQPEYAKNLTRSDPKYPNVLVVLGVCTHLGCSPTYRKEVGAADLGADWPGGFFCPCHGSKFDMAARVFKGVPAPSNLEVPPYTYLSDARLLVGEKRKGS
ncbi:MAG TPA: ubiquinol-cytochrome c reductase iron-sulfur subunit [Burkholderiales bacterium]|jgi:ubiquinol-cytochrome c reductase iron-sulfur subunit|nr:ubiquinol-cytochrome c reductase iron-sulfur subunit [Burkholderiales bacterium]